MKFCFKNKQYDVCIPFGEECYTCESIDNKFNISKDDIRFCSFPFDYVGHTFVSSLAKIMNDQYFQIKNEDLDICLFGDKYFYVDKHYKLNYWHDVSYNDINSFTQNDIEIFVNKYNRRYKRLYEKLLTNHVLVISVCHFDDIYNSKNKLNEIEQLFESLQKINKNISLLAFNFYETDIVSENFFHVNIPFHKTTSFEETKKGFKSNLFQYIQTYFTTSSYFF
jgi:hypothetical protein